MAQTLRDLLNSADIWRDVLSRRESWLLICGNALPLIGIFLLGWDASTLLILYWLESAVVGAWLFVRLILTHDTHRPNLAGIAINGDGVALAVFLLFHGGLFMYGHLFFLGNLARGEWSDHMTSLNDFIFGFVLPSGLWIPLAGLFVVRGVLTIGEIRSGNSASHLIAAFYARIIVMQFVIIFGAMLAMMLGSPIPLLVLVVVLKTGIELFWDRLIGPFAASFST